MLSTTDALQSCAVRIKAYEADADVPVVAVSQQMLLHYSNRNTITVNFTVKHSR
jgi:hypothetical protein